MAISFRSKLTRRTETTSFMLLLGKQHAKRMPVLRGGLEPLEKLRKGSHDSNGACEPP